MRVRKWFICEIEDILKCSTELFAREINSNHLSSHKGPNFYIL